MAKYIAQYYRKKHSLSKYKDLLEIRQKTKDANGIESLKKRYIELFLNVRSVNVSLDELNKTRLIKKISENKKIQKYIVEKIKEFSNGGISYHQFITDVFDEAKKNKTRVSRNHFLLLAKKIDREKSIKKIKESPDYFIHNAKWIIKELDSEIKNNFEVIITQLRVRDGVKRLSEENVAPIELFGMMKKSFFDALINKNNVSFRAYRKIFFKIVSGDPITDKDIYSLFKIKKFLLNEQKKL